MRPFAHKRKVTKLADTTIMTESRRLSRRGKAVQGAIRRIALVAALGVGLGLLIQLVIVCLRLIGGVSPSLLALADLAQAVTWSVLVCTGVAIGMAIGKARTALAGVFAAFFAPLSMAAAKAMQKVIGSLLGALEQPALLSMATIGVVRALEYGILAWLLAWLSERKERRMHPYLLAGGGVGVLFGGFIVALSILSTTGENEMGILKISTLATSEVGAPLGCAAVIYITQLVATQARLWARASS